MCGLLESILYFLYSFFFLLYLDDDGFRGLAREEGGDADGEGGALKGERLDVAEVTVEDDALDEVAHFLQKNRSKVSFTNCVLKAHFQSEGVFN